MNVFLNLKGKPIVPSLIVPLSNSDNSIPKYSRSTNHGGGWSVSG